MADRLDYYFRQKVTEAELDLGFTLLEQADRDFANDIGIFGIIDGMVASEKAGVPDLSVDLTAPGRAYDQLGERIFFGTAQNVDLSTDLNGVSTAVQSGGNERIVSLFIKFDRALSDPRTDGNSQQVFFRRDETFKFVVRQGAEASAGTAVPPPLQSDEVLVVDVTRAFGQTQVLNADLNPNPTIPGDVGRRQNFIFAEASAISVFSGGFNTLAPITDDVQAALQEVDDELTDHFGATARRHDAPDVDATAAAGSPNALTVGTVRSQLDELLSHINAHENQAAAAHAASSVAYAGGSSWADGGTNPAASVESQLDKVVADLSATSGAPKVGAAATAGSPNALSAGSVKSQLDQLLADINAHENDASGAHAASAIAYAGSGTWADATSVSGASVEAALDEVVSDLGATSGAPKVGAAATAGSPNALVAGTAKSQLDELLGHINDHENDSSGAHTASAISYAGGGNWLGGRTNPATSIEAQLDKIITDLAAQTANDDGAERIGAQAVAGSPSSLAVGSLRSQLNELLGFVNVSARTNVAQTWTEGQTFNGDGSDTDAALIVGVNPTTRKLAFEFNGGSFRLRLYYADNQLEFTANARWDGAQWERDSTGFFASRMILARNDFLLQHVRTGVAQPFNDSEWAGSFSRQIRLDLDGVSDGQLLNISREREVPGGPLTGYSAVEGEWGSTQANIGGGASFASGRLPSAPSSITFTVHSQFNTANTPSAFVSQRMGVGWFDSVSGTLPHTSYMFLSFSAT